MRRITLLAAVFVLAVLPWPAGRASAVRADEDAFALAVLRRDGVVIPFAYFSRSRGFLERGGRWMNDWPLAGKDFDVPLQLSDVPEGWWPFGQPIVSWTAWPSRGGKTEVQSQAPVAVVTHCQLGVGIRTSYRSAEPAPPETAQPYPKDGLATSGSVTVEHPAIVDVSSPEWKAAAAEVQREVTYLEDGQIKLATMAGLGSHPSERDRTATAFVPETIVRVTPRALYFEGVKTYSPRVPLIGRGDAQVPNRCNNLTYSAGWVLFPNEGKPKVEAAARITDCNRDGLVYSLPLGLIPRENAVLYVVQVSGWDYEHYEVLEVRGDRVKSLFSVPGGWCR